MTVNDNDLRLTKKQQTKIVDELIGKSRPSSPYNMLLFSSAIIIASGLLMDNMAIVIGGMLVTPLLTPVLSLALGVSVGEMQLVARSFRITLTSLAIVVILGTVFGMLFQIDLVKNVVLNQVIRSGSEIPILYMIVALTAGGIGTFAWVNEDIHESLPGIVIAVSLFPPLSALGIGLGLASFDLMRNAFLIFILNLGGIFFGSLVAFNFMNFYRAKSEAHKQILIEEKEEEQKKKDNGKK